MFNDLKIQYVRQKSRDQNKYYSSTIFTAGGS